MRLAVTVAVLLAVVATALVAVCQHGESRRLQRRVWQLEQRRLRLEHRAERLLGAIEATRTPRRLLVEHDRASAGGEVAPAGPRAAPARPGADVSRVRAVLAPAGFNAGANFEGDRR